MSESVRQCSSIGFIRFLSGKYPSCLVIVGCILFLYTLAEPYWLKIKRVEICNSEIPDSFVGTRIVFLADLHHGPCFSIERVKSVVKMVNSLKPDIILLGGDYVHQSTQYIAPVFSVLANLKARLFKGGVLGNHDHWESAKLTRTEMKKAGITLLDNDARWIEQKGERIRIGGVGDLWEDQQFPEMTIEEVRKTDFTVLLSHNPDYFPKIRDKRIDLVLSGHTHGGQVTLFGLWAPIIPIGHRKYWRGYFRNVHSSLLVTTGVGTIFPPVRFFCRPEIMEITLKH
ncbi:MAG: metallophosphoesterase [Candidatus Wallbacteria bacterium HGW-Wallbacteria-1]|jgi:hypothetical protein|uniref:Metallophosphoesterase n=1 Tax=Candidatus Wallbacteria bacterium HGW-Wallbacteria-1 TaxID=2013854 RepID=A0A2N1PN24_9BACT|nr:MAG: metallophosphoesterase [Candidatus Wallbacteria bacterium HGW-Wallbacteria-1]